MNKDLLQLIKDYATKKHSDISSDLIGKSKDNLVAMLLDLLTTYYNDLNSSTVRELVVAVISGYEPNTEKLGYNGFRQNTLTGAVEHCEIKPRNYRTDSTAKSPSKLNGGGNFTDYSWGKFKRHKEENPNMLAAGFVDGKLIYILEFSFNEQGFISQLEKKLNKRFPNGDITGEYLRSADFSYTHYKGSESLKAIYITSKEELIEVRPYLIKDLYVYLRRTTPLEETIFRGETP